MPSSNLRIVLKIVCASGTLRRVSAQTKDNIWHALFSGSVHIKVTREKGKGARFVLCIPY
jgi:hypothetical protein